MAVFVAQLVAQLLPKSEVHSLNPVNGIFLHYTVNCIVKNKIKKRDRDGPNLLKTSINVNGDRGRHIRRYYHTLKLEKGPNPDHFSLFSSYPHLITSKLNSKKCRCLDSNPDHWCMTIVPHHCTG